MGLAGPPMGGRRGGLRWAMTCPTADRAASVMAAAKTRAARRELHTIGVLPPEWLILSGAFRTAGTSGRIVAQRPTGWQGQILRREESWRPSPGLAVLCRPKKARTATQSLLNKDDETENGS